MNSLGFPHSLPNRLFHCNIIEEHLSAWRLDLDATAVDIPIGSIGWVRMYADMRITQAQDCDDDRKMVGIGGLLHSQHSSHQCLNQPPTNPPSKFRSRLSTIPSQAKACPCHLPRRGGRYKMVLRRPLPRLGAFRQPLEKRL